MPAPIDARKAARAIICDKSKAAGGRGGNDERIVGLSPRARRAAAEAEGVKIGLSLPTQREERSPRRETEKGARCP